MPLQEDALATCVLSEPRWEMDLSSLHFQWLVNKQSLSFKWESKESFWHFLNRLLDSLPRIYDLELQTVVTTQLLSQPSSKVFPGLRNLTVSSKHLPSTHSPTHQLHSPTCLAISSNTAPWTQLTSSQAVPGISLLPEAEVFAERLEGTEVTKGSNILQLELSKWPLVSKLQILKENTLGL